MSVDFNKLPSFGKDGMYKDVSNLDFTNIIDRNEIIHIPDGSVNWALRIKGKDYERLVITEDQYYSYLYTTIDPATQKLYDPLPLKGFKVPTYAKYQGVKKLSDIIILLNKKPDGWWVNVSNVWYSSLNEKYLTKIIGHGYQTAKGKTVVMHHSATYPRTNATGLYQYKKDYIRGNIIGGSLMSYTPYFVVLDPMNGDIYLNNIQAIDNFIGYQVGGFNTASRGICIDGSFSYHHTLTNSTSVGLEFLTVSVEKREFKTIEYLTNQTNFEKFKGVNIPTFYANGKTIENIPVFISFLAMMINLKTPRLVMHFVKSATACPGILGHVFLTWLSEHDILNKVDAMLLKKSKELVSGSDEKTMYNEYIYTVRNFEIGVNTLNLDSLAYIYGLDHDVVIDFTVYKGNLKDFQAKLKTDNIFTDNIRNRMVSMDKQFTKQDYMDELSPETRRDTMHTRKVFGG